jgi:proteasome lid subunit RPN8/RPN11
MTVQFKNAPGGADFLSRRKRERKNIGSNQLLAQKVYTKSSRSSSAVKSSAMVIITHTHTRARALSSFDACPQRAQREYLLGAVCESCYFFGGNKEDLLRDAKKSASSGEDIFVWYHIGTAGDHGGCVKPLCAREKKRKGNRLGTQSNQTNTSSTCTTMNDSNERKRRRRSKSE